MNNLLNKGDVVKTSLSDSTLVLKIEGNDALLFTGRQFVVAHGVQKDNDKVFWNQGDYYDELPEDIFEIKKNFNQHILENEIETDINIIESEKIINDLLSESKLNEEGKNFSYETFCKYVKNKMSTIYQNDEGQYEMLQDTESLQDIVFEKIGLQTEEKALKYIYSNNLFDELKEVIVQATTSYKYREAYKKLNFADDNLNNYTLENEDELEDDW